MIREGLVNRVWEGGCGRYVAESNKHKTLTLGRKRRGSQITASGPKPHRKKRKP